MKTITELKKERLTIRTLDPIRSMVLTMLIDSATKIAKEDYREPDQKDIETCAKRMYKETEKDIDMISSHGETPTELMKELDILKEFIPIQMNEIAIRKLISEMPTETLTKKNMGSIMKSMKTIEHMDISLLSKILNEVLV